MIDGLDHIAIAVRNIEDAIRTYTSLFGVDVDAREYLPERHLEVAFLRVGDVVLELICPTGEESTVHGFLEKKGEGLHHVAFKASDVRSSAELLEKRGFRLAQSPAAGARGTRVLFVHPKDSHGVLIELVEET